MTRAVVYISVNWFSNLKSVYAQLVLDVTFSCLLLSLCSPVLYFFLASHFLAVAIECGHNES